MEGLCGAFKKIKNSGKLTEEDTKCLAAFVDSFITVSTCEKKVGKDIAATVREVNQHRHSKTCRKYGGRCRFNYPRPPAPHTIIVQPVVVSDPEKRNKILLESDRIIVKVMKVLEDEESMKKFWERMEKVKKSTRLLRIMTLCIIAKVDFEDCL